MLQPLVNRFRLARVIFRLLPMEGPFCLAIDRTNWQFGSTDINVFMLAVVHDGVAYPLLFSMLPKKGASNTKERIGLVQRYVRLFGVESIDCLLADREFVGEHWVKWLNDSGIRYHIRIRENFWVDRPSSGRRAKASWLFADLRVGEAKCLHKICHVNGQACYLSASKVKPIRILKHGRKAKSIFRYGLDIVTEFLLRGRNEYKIPIFNLLAIVNQILTLD